MSGWVGPYLLLVTARLLRRLTPPEVTLCHMPVDAGSWLSTQLGAEVTEDVSVSSSLCPLAQAPWPGHWFTSESGAFIADCEGGRQPTHTEFFFLKMLILSWSHFPGIEIDIRDSNWHQWRVQSVTIGMNRMKTDMLVVSFDQRFYLNENHDLAIARDSSSRADSGLRVAFKCLNV